MKILPVILNLILLLFISSCEKMTNPEISRNDTIPEFPDDKGDSILDTIFYGHLSDQDIIPKDSAFHINFSDGSSIQMNDIVLYDTSSCILLLKDRLHVSYGPSPDASVYIKFNAMVNDKIIFSGSVWDYYSSNHPAPTSFFISSRPPGTIDSEIIPFTVDDYYGLNPEIIGVFADQKKLCAGVSCVLDSINISLSDAHYAIITITFSNLDSFNYYIVDPNKISSSYVEGFLNLDITNQETEVQYYELPDTWESTARNFTMDNVSLLETDGNLSFTYSMRYTEEFIPGNYNCYMHYNTNDCVGHFKIPLQPIV